MVLDFGANLDVTTTANIPSNVAQARRSRVGGAVCGEIYGTRTGSQSIREPPAMTASPLNDYRIGKTKWLLTSALHM
jgi:hypothetical protein